MRKQMICLLLALAMVIGLFAACGSTAASSAAAESAGSAAAESAAAPAEEMAVEAPAAEPETGSSASEEVAETEPEKEAGPLGYVETSIELPLVDEPMTYTLMTKVPPLVGDGLPGLKDNMVFQEMEKRTGIHLDITEVSTWTYNEQFMLMVAGGDWTDLMTTVRSTYSGGLAAALSEEVIVDLSKYEEYMPNYMGLIRSDENLYRDVTQGDGSIGAFFACYSDFYDIDAGLLIRADWLDKLGLESPETVDEYYDVLTAFHNMNGSVMHLPKNGIIGNQPFVSAWDVSAFFIDAGFFNSLLCYSAIDGKLVCGLTEPGFKEYLMLMNKWYSEGLISHDYMSVPVATNLMVGSDSQSLSDLLNDRIGVWGDSVTTVVNYDGTNAVDPNFRAEPAKFPTLEKGGTIKTGLYACRADEGYYSVSTTCHDPEIIIQWIDYAYTSDGFDLYNWGIEGETYTVNADGSKQFTDMILDNPDGYSVDQAKYVFLGSESYLHDMDALHAVYTDLQLECFDVWNCNLTCEYATSNFLAMTADEGDRFSELSSDIITYCNESVAKFITGEKNFDEDYDAFLADLKNLNIDELTELEQVVYDRWAGVSK